MKLIDILARELKVWPEDSDGEVGQCSNGQLHGISNRHLKSIELKRCFTVAEDYFSGRVSEAQWLNAVMALEVENVNFNDPMKNNGPVAAEWNGEGLPPVGAVCEARAKQSGSWRPYEVIASTVNYLIVEAEEEGETPIRHAFWEFRRLLSAEQIAAEEREAGIQEMRFAAGSLNDYPFVQLWDAGYRKQVAQ